MKSAVALLQLAYGLAMIAASSLVEDGERYFLLFDDAMISLAYARTWVSGEGLVWFPGAEWVQGFTNPLWTAAMALPHVVGLPARLASLPVQLAGLGLVIATGLAAARVHEALRPGNRMAWTTQAIAGGCFPLLLWSTFGMEAGPG